MDNDPSTGSVGKRLLPQVVDGVAVSNPKRVWASSPRSLDLIDGFRDITFAELANAVNYVAWWIERRMGCGEDFETLSYMGATDVRYIVIFLAAIKRGYKLLVPSARNSASGNLSLLKELQCVKFIHSADISIKAGDLKAQKPDLQLYTIPSYKEMTKGQSELYPYDKTFAEGENDWVCVCHTSGSTGKLPRVLVEKIDMQTVCLSRSA